MFRCILFFHSSLKSPFKIKLLRIIREFPSVVPSGMGTCGRQQAPAVQCPGSSAQLCLPIFWGVNVSCLSVWEDVVLGSIRSHWFLCTRLPTALHTCVCVLCLIGREWQCGRKALATQRISALFLRKTWAPLRACLQCPWGCSPLACPWGVTAVFRVVTLDLHQPQSVGVMESL